MFAFAIFAFTAMLVAGTATGIRLLVAAWRNRRDPELWIGLSTLLSATGGAVAVASNQIAATGHLGHAFALQLVARLMYLISGSGLCIGLWRVYQPDRIWGATLAVAVSMAFAAFWGAWAAGGAHTSVTGTTPVLLGFYTVRILPFLWGAIYSFRYHELLRRRQRLGLADPVIAHQFLLWAIASASMVGLTTLVVVAYAAVGISPLEWTPTLFGMSLCGLAGASTIYTAFFPPTFYRRWVAARAPLPG